MITATYEAECPPRQFVFLLSACQHYQHMLSKSLRVAVLHTTNLPTAHLSSYMLQKRTVTHYWPAFILLAGLHLVRVARLSSFAGLAYSYALLVSPHSPCWPTSRTGYSSALILHTGLLFLGVARRHSFSTQAYCSYASLV